ncbi:MAG: arsenite methyltransferase [Chloroflexi bacterium]|nr:arsenite methyltransferase [Chloroflexota bacterium]
MEAIVDEQEIKKAIRQRYAAKAIEAGGCCGRSNPDSKDRARRLYDETELAGLPDSVTSVSLGCGNPLALAELRPGQVVLDLGSGGGIDCFLAASRVGDSGRVIGLDMSAEMVALATENARKLGVNNVEFRLGEIEAIPVDSGTVDLVISNCVICLSPNKDMVFNEAFRVLKPGGRLHVSDEAWEDGRGYNGTDPVGDWTKCLAGAIERNVYLSKVRAAGFGPVEVVEEARRERHSGEREGLLSIKVRAVKP